MKLSHFKLPWLKYRLGKDSDKQFAVLSTLHWFRSLSIVLDDYHNKSIITQFYNEVNPRKSCDSHDNLVFSNLLLSLHHHASLDNLSSSSYNKIDICRLAIIACYYSVYFSSRAMIAAKSGSDPKNHSDNTRDWQHDIVNDQLIPYTFNLSITNLVKKEAEAQLNVFKQDLNNYKLIKLPCNVNDARAQLVHYLSGTVNWKIKSIEEKIKKDEKLENFRTKNAQVCRDQLLAKKRVNFLDQMYRMRVKANYRDSLYLSYNLVASEETMSIFVSDLLFVSNSFLECALSYSRKRVVKAIWSKFVNDIIYHSSFSIDSDIIQKFQAPSTK